MKTKKLIRCIIDIIIVITVIGMFTTKKTYAKGELLEIKPANNLVSSKNTKALKLNYTVEELRKIRIARKEAEELARQQEEERKRQEEENRIVFDGLTMRELSDKLNRTLHSTLSGQGETFARLSDELGVDPYLSVAIVMLETGCKWECSNLLKTCNNVGGMKGAGGCGGGAYAYFPTLDEGIRAYMSNLQRNYVAYGLTTPEAMGPKYAASPTWAENVRKYMNEIKAN